MRARAIHFSGTDFMLSPGDLSPVLLEDVMECGVGGRSADEYCEYVMENYTITGDVEDCKAYLRGYGAWSEDELEDHGENLLRLIWLTAGSFHEEGDVYFCTY